MNSLLLFYFSIALTPAVYILSGALFLKLFCGKGVSFTRALAASVFIFVLFIIGILQLFEIRDTVAEAAVWGVPGAFEKGTFSAALTGGGCAVYLYLASALCGLCTPPLRREAVWMVPIAGVMLFLGAIVMDGFKFPGTVGLADPFSLMFCFSLFASLLMFTWIFLSRNLGFADSELPAAEPASQGQKLFSEEDC